MSSKATGKIKQVSFANNAKGEVGGAPAKHLSDMTAFERIAYVQSLDFDKEDHAGAVEVDEGLEHGKITKDVFRRFVSIHFRSCKYRLQLGPASRQEREGPQTSILKEEVTSPRPDLLRVVQCLERGERTAILLILSTGHSTSLSTDTSCGAIYSRSCTHTLSHTHAGANPNAVVDRAQSRPLHAVIRRGDPRLVDYLLQAGADVNGVDG